MRMTMKDHIKNLSYIMDSMPDDSCGDWRDSIAYAILIIKRVDEIYQQVYDKEDCFTCTHGTWKRKGGDITMADDACGGCCSWNNKYEPFVSENLNKGDDTSDIIDQMKKDFIDRYPKNRMGELYLGGRNCYFSLNQVLNILDMYKKEKNS